MQIEVISFSEQHMPSKTGGYNKGVIEYLKDGQWKNKQNLVSFKNPAVYNAVKNAKQGDKFEVTVTKNGDFNEWSAISLSSDGSGSAPSASTSSVSKPAGKVLGSTYETPVERAIRQRLIVRQSSLSNAITMLTTGAKSPPAFDDVLAMANAFVEFVFATESLMDEQPEEEKDIPF